MHLLAFGINVLPHSVTRGPWVYVSPPPSRPGVRGVLPSALFTVTRWPLAALSTDTSKFSLRILTVAGIPSPAAAHFLMHCCKVSIPFCSMPFAMLAPSVTRPVGASIIAVHDQADLVRHSAQQLAKLTVYSKSSSSIAIFDCSPIVNDFWISSLCNEWWWWWWSSAFSGSFLGRKVDKIFTSTNKLCKSFLPYCLDNYTSPNSYSLLVCL